MDAMGMLSLLCLIITGSLASWGIFSQHFDDNLMQRIGLAAVAIACFLRIPGKIETPQTPPEILLAQMGLCFYGIGTAVNLWRKSRLRDRRGARRGFGVGI